MKPHLLGWLCLAGILTVGRIGAADRVPELLPAPEPKKISFTIKSKKWPNGIRGETPRTADDFSLAAKQAMFDDDFEMTEKYLRQAVELYQMKDAAAAEGYAYNSASALTFLGGVLSFNGKNREALPLLRKALARHEANGFDLDATSANLTQALTFMYRFTDAEALLARRWKDDLNRAPDNKTDQIDLLQRLGRLYQTANRREDADRCNRQGLKLTQNAHNNYAAAVFASYLAESATRDGRTDDAERLLRLAKQHNPACHLELEWGRLHLGRGELAKAEAVLMPEHDRLKDRLGTKSLSFADVLVALAEAAERGDRKAEAIKHLRRALELRERCLGPTHPAVADCLEALARIDPKQPADTAERIAAIRREQAKQQPRGLKAVFPDLIPADPPEVLPMPKPAG